MSHAAPEPPSRRRVDRVVGVALALVGLAVAVVAVLALQNPKGRQAGKAIATATITSTVTPSHAATPSSTPPASHAPASTHPASPSTTTGTPQGAHPIPLIVLNNTSTSNLADTAATRFRQGGWTVTGVDNLNNDILSTCAYYDPGYAGAEQAAEQLQQQFPAIKRVKPKFDGLPPGPIIVVLTTDYS